MGIHDVGARIEVTLDAIRRFIKRNDPWADRRLQVVGPEYAASRLDVAEAARVLQLSISDTVAKLEECGYARPLEHVELTDDERSNM